jgi:hypothetical protein
LANQVFNVSGRTFGQIVRQYGYNVQDISGDIAAALDSAETDTALVDITSNVTLSSDDTLKAHVGLRFGPGGKLTLTDTLFIEAGASLEASPYQQIFDIQSGGAVIWHESSRVKASPFWFNGTEISKGIRGIIDSFTLKDSSSVVVYLPAGVHGTTKSRSTDYSMIQVSEDSTFQNFKMIGDGIGITVFQVPDGHINDSTGYAFFQYNILNNAASQTASRTDREKGLHLEGFSVLFNGDLWNGTDYPGDPNFVNGNFYINNVERVTLRDIEIDHAGSVGFEIIGCQDLSMERVIVDTVHTLAGTINGINVRGNPGTTELDQSQSAYHFRLDRIIAIGDPDFWNSTDLSADSVRFSGKTNGQGIWTGLYGANGISVTNSFAHGWSNGIGIEGALLDSATADADQVGMLRHGRVLMQGNTLLECKRGTDILMQDDSYNDTHYGYNGDLINRHYQVHDNLYRFCETGVNIQGSDISVLGNHFEEVYLAVSVGQIDRRPSRRNVNVSENIVRLRDTDETFSGAVMSLGLAEYGTTTGTGDFENVIFSKNIIYGSDEKGATNRHGLWIQGNARGVLISGNIMNGIEGAPIIVGDVNNTAYDYGPRDVKVAYNIIGDSNTNGTVNYPAGINIMEYAQSVDVSWNTVRDSLIAGASGMDGIYVQALAKDVTIAHNDLRTTHQGLELNISSSAVNVYTLSNRIHNDPMSGQVTLSSGTATISNGNILASWTRMGYDYVSGTASGALYTTAKSNGSATVSDGSGSSSTVIWYEIR